MKIRSIAFGLLAPGIVSAQQPPIESSSEPNPPSSGVREEEEDSIPLKQPAPREEPSAQSTPAEKNDGTRRAPSAEKSEKRAQSPDERENDDDLDDDDDEPTESPQFGYFGIGPAMLNIDGIDEYGFAMGAGGRFPFHDRMAINAGVTWGLTSFDRTGEWWEEARKIGRWTSNAYANVTEWAGEGEDDEALRYMAAFYAYIGLLFPYAVSGIMYIVGPFAATSYLDFHMEATFHLFETRNGPYVGGGLGTAAVIFPIEREMKGALGPSLNLGYDFGWFGIEARGFYSPPHLHGEPSVYRTDVFTGQMLFRFQGK